MSLEKDHCVDLYELRNASLISLKDRKRMSRAGRFLIPCARNEEEAVCIPKTPLLSEIWDHSLVAWPLNVVFQGWKIPQKDWKQWVDNLEPRYNRLWRNSGVYDAIISSTYGIRCKNNQPVLGLTEFWCVETNTFVFPWGEATITLEDVMVLGGYPVLGEPVTAMPTHDLIRTVGDLENKRKEFSSTRTKKASFSLWLEKYKGRGDEFEHLAFLSLWLSRFVFPSDNTIRKNVFPIAVLLSRGNQVALAQAVLASLYRDLKLMTEKAKIQSESSISVVAPFQLLQLWAFERFPLLAPKNPNVFQTCDEPRVARWDKLISTINLPLVRSILKVRENYKWRPYASDLENWHVSPYSDTDKFYPDCSKLTRMLRSFSRCIKSGELAGLGFTEKYMPHRVAMQFGLDQDLPAAHNDYYVTSGLGGICVPSQFIEAGISMRYLKWWETSMADRQVVIERRRTPRIFVKDRLQADTPRRQTPLSRTVERRFGTNFSSSFEAKKRMDDTHHADSQHHPHKSGGSYEKVTTGRFERSGGSYEKGTTGRFERRLGPPAARANESVKHVKRKADALCSSQSLDHRLQGRQMKEHKVTGSFHDREKNNSARRSPKTNDHNNRSDIGQKGHQGIGLEKRLERIEKMLGVDSQTKVN